MRRFARSLAVLALVATATPALTQAQRVTSPREHFGFNVGDDYRLFNYTRFLAYFEKLARESDRMELDTIGLTAEGRPQVMAIVSSPANLARKDRYRQIAERLGRADGVSEAEAQALAKEGKAIVWIDGGLHATEVLGAAQLTETIYRLVSMSDEETMRFLNDVIVLGVHANPDGMELVSNWYMRNPDETKRSSSGIPRLYQKYIGHDNNRDFYLNSQPETENISRVQFMEWYPQIVFNHHQTGPAGAVLFAPPFRDPHNYQLDPLVLLGIDLVGTAMHTRFLVEGKPGAVRREGASYQTWWNGGLRTATYFHNMIGLLTETIGNPTPIEIPFTPGKVVSTGDYPLPIAPQRWHFRQSVEYSVTSNKAVLDVASRHREQLLFNFWKMGNNAIEKGKRDNWTTMPRHVAMVRDSLERARAAQTEGPRAGNVTGQAQIAPTAMFAMLRAPELRDPRGYIIPSDQPDFLTATKFVNALQKSGITIHRATRAFSLGGKSYPAGSYAISTAQAFRAHVLDMMEPQDYPNDLLYPGGPPKAPYDNAGYTLAYQMGIRFDRHLDSFDGPFEKIEGMARPPAGTVARATGAAGFLFSHQQNDAFLAISRLLKSGDEVHWLNSPAQANGRTYPAGTFYVVARGSTLPILQRLATENGLSFDGVTTRPSVETHRLRTPRIALWDTYGGSMPSGWTRWLLEQFEFPYEVVYPQQLDAGNLNAKYDVVVLPDGSVPSVMPTQTGFGGFGSPPRAEDIPAEFRGWLGRVTPERTVPQLRRFLEDGGKVVAIGSGTNLAYHLKLPLQNHLVEFVDGAEREIPRERLFIPGSVLQVAVDSTHPVAFGMYGRADVLMDQSPVFRLSPDAGIRGVRSIAWFDSARPLRSGWAWGQQYLDGGVAAAEVKLGRGTVYLFGPEVLFRAQPHGTFKFFFNSLLAPQRPAVTAATGVPASAQ